MNNVNDYSRPIGKYLKFSNGRFHLTREAQETIYRGKGAICSYSGSCEWSNHFFCEIIDLYTGASVYNYCLSSYKHEELIYETWNKTPEDVIGWLEDEINEEWFKNAIKSFEMVFENIPNICQF